MFTRRRKRCVRSCDVFLFYKNFHNERKMTKRYPNVPSGHCTHYFNVDIFSKNYRTRTSYREIFFWFLSVHCFCNRSSSILQSRELHFFERQSTIDRLAYIYGAYKVCTFMYFEKKLKKLAARVLRVLLHRLSLS